jgi:hypothetical protein
LTVSIDSATTFFFDVSPNGRFAAFYTIQLGEPSRFGLWEIGETPTCLLNQNSPDRVSVSDSGDIIFVTDAGESCYYKDGEHYSTKPLPGYDTGDTCPDVAHWHKRMTEPEVLERLARHPQWLSDDAASRLLAWGKQPKSN